jgi:hypothetical protein
MTKADVHENSMMSIAHPVMVRSPVTQRTTLLPTPQQ